MELIARLVKIITALGNPTGDMSAVIQSDAADLAAYILRFREHYRAHDQTRICLIVPDLAGFGADAQNTAIKAELDKIGSVSLLDQTGVNDGQEDWNVYDLVVVGSNAAGVAFVDGSIDDLKSLKLPIMVCNDDVAALLEMGTAGVARSTSDNTEYCKSIHNRVMYLVFGTVDEQVIFDSAQQSDRLDMDDPNLAVELLMVDAAAHGSALTVLGWLPMETAIGTLNKLEDGTEIPAGRLFAGCFLHADHLNETGQLLLRRIARNLTQASITPSISLKAQAALVAAIHNDTNALENRWTAALATILGNFTALRIGYLDQLDFDLQEALTAIAGFIDTEIQAIITTLGTPANFMADVSALALEATVDAGFLAGAKDATVAKEATVDAVEAKLDKTLFTMDFWSDLQEEVQVTSTANPTLGLPSVDVADLPADALIVRAVAMFKFRMVENIHETEANNLILDQYIQVKKSGQSYTNAIKMITLGFAIAAATREGGDVIIGNIDLAAVNQVDGNATYEFLWKTADAAQNSLNFNDIQCGLKIFYSV